MKKIPPYRLATETNKGRRSKGKRPDPIQKATMDLETECRKQITVLFSATAIALWRYWGKRKVTIGRLFDVANEAFAECRSSLAYSMIQICEKETGIELQNGEGKSWHEIPFLNAELDAGSFTPAKFLYMRKQQLPWVRPQVFACILVSMHRKYGFGYVRCARLYGQIQEVEEEFGSSPEKLRTACLELTTLDVKTVLSDKKQKENG